MAEPTQTITFRRRDFKGSRLRCLMLTGLPADRRAAVLNDLVAEAGAAVRVTPEDPCLPLGFLRHGEARLDEPAVGLLGRREADAIADWWLRVRRGARTPCWDIASRCTVDGRPGLLLVEAKAHAAELRLDDRCGAEGVNREQITRVIAEANEHLGRLVPGTWGLSAESHYQLSNRLAWAWKLADLGVPTVLVYLGFVAAAEMSGGFATAADWTACLHGYADGRVPAAAWTAGPVDVNGTPLITLIRAATVDVAAAVLR